MTEIPRRRAEVSGHFVQFYSRNPNLATVRWHSRFKAEYRTKAQAQEAKQLWEEKGRILQAEKLKNGTESGGCEQKAALCDVTYVGRRRMKETLADHLNQSM